MIRRWLRALVGWDEQRQALFDNDAKVDDLTRSLNALHDRIEAHETRINRLYRRTEQSTPAVRIRDWEEQQVEFLNNPENFKEVN